MLFIWLINMVDQLLEIFKQIKGVDISKIKEIQSIHKERQLAMAELSAILGVDVRFSNEEMIANIAEMYVKREIKNTLDELTEAIVNG